MKLFGQWIVYIGIPTALIAVIKLHAIPGTSWWWLAAPSALLLAILLIILGTMLLVHLLTS